MGSLSQLYNLDPQNTTVVRESVNWSDMRFRFLWKTKKAAGFKVFDFTSSFHERIYNNCVKVFFH